MNPTVKCDADTCVHNHNGMCIATDIEINYDATCMAYEDK